ncbi:ancient ubiquitous protein 1-like isoform X2 [Acanthaster planci]|nr:ancient ubiquitous protein 1-like isoform X2 [Acanthaster planci]XP_022086638.1 ancient ubiquitous protein 1-like isoform X2 [Acanthaster planci]XP_022086639.1 ancient ubiquitous protein 1-like isoform X2 [Acanthaster planci]XP_022086640.1 ancient ubiquitous protein 1-like isoform X2 [Acanthaster planci]XP_022086641.1 ancient ubiquitous protein 1-like isoform X2 [Acanthaster planci]
MNTDISELFSSERLTGGSLAGVLLLVYMPLGLILTVLRIFLGFHVFIVSCLLPRASLIRRVILRVMCLLLGLVVSHEGLEQRDKAAKVIVANHVSVFDHVTIGLVVPSIVPNVWSLPAFMTWALGYTEMGAREGRRTLLLNLKAHCARNTLPITSLPEGAMTNGKTGLLKFSTWPFDLGEAVQPVVLKVRRPLLGVNVETIGSSLWKDIFWFLFVPFTHFHVRLLPSQRQEESETVENYSRRVQGIMAQELDTKVTPFTSADKAEYIKRSFIYQPEASTPQVAAQQTTPSPVPATPQPQAALPTPTEPRTPAGGATAHSDDNERQLRQMVQQVKEVLPYVSEAAVRRDLEKTNCIDTTITNILEGKIPSELPEAPDRTEQEGVGGASASPPSTPSPSSLKFAAASFGKSSNARQLSYKERKEALFQKARRHYMEKHGITLD